MNKEKQEHQKINAADFGKDFKWGVATAAAQIEGAYNVGGKSASIWDVYSIKKGNTKRTATTFETCDFYHRYKDDLLLVKALGFKIFRFSISWCRILPEGSGKINKEGIAFYNKVIDECLKLGLVPYITLYHWDLPYCLQKEGGWSSVFMIKWFKRFVSVCAEEFGDRVKSWIILNEPMGFTSLGYMLGKHAPGKTGIQNFLPAVHNAALAQAEGGRIIRRIVPNVFIGTTFSCSEVVPFSDSIKDIQAADRIDILMNRLFVEPALGLGYPENNFPLMEKLQMHTKAWKYTKQLQFDFDFIGIQNYFPLTVKYNTVIPYVQAIEVKPKSRGVPYTDMGWEINPDSFYRMIKRFAVYENVKEIIVTENGACFKDIVANGIINDEQRIRYYESYLLALLRAKKEGINVTGYFAWTLMDNFEWAEGFEARFGLVHVDFKTQLRTVKNSGYWWRDLLSTK